MVIGGYQGTEITSKLVQVLNRSSNTWEVEEMSTSKSALSSGVFTFNSLVEVAEQGCGKDG